MLDSPALSGARLTLSLALLSPNGEPGPSRLVSRLSSAGQVHELEAGSSGASKHSP